MSTVTISLPESLKSFVEEEVAAKGYGNVSEYFRALLREAQTREADAHLEALLLEGLASGKPVQSDPAFWRALRAEAKKIVEARASKKKKV